MIILGNVIKARLTLSREGRRINKIISPLLDRGGGMWDLDGKEREKKEAEGATDPVIITKHQSPIPTRPHKFYVHTREGTMS